jgi:hypothetical protein
MAEENNYSESPYVVSRTALLARQYKQDQINTSQSIHGSFQQQYQQQQQNQQYKPQHSSFPSPHQQQSNTSNSSHHMQLQHHHQLQPQLSLESATTSSNGSNQIDKENRHFSLSSNNDFNSKLQISNNFPSSAKSNAIFDRFDIMNSEKPHRFKVI